MIVVVACAIFIHGFSRCRGYCCLPSTTYHNCLCRGFFILYYPTCKFQSLFSFWIACDIPNIEVDTKEQVARHNQPNAYFEVYTHTTNRQQNTQTQYPRHREKPRINMTGKYNYCIKNTTAVWNLTPPANIALIPQ